MGTQPPSPLGRNNLQETEKFADCSPSTLVQIANVFREETEIWMEKVVEWVEQEAGIENSGLRKRFQDFLDTRMVDLDHTLKGARGQKIAIILMRERIAARQGDFR
jgi:hypothetical protein